MKKLFFFAIALLWTGFSSFSKTLPLQEEFISPSHRYIQYIGRISHKTPDAIRFNYPGVQIRASFRSTSLKMYAKPMSGFFMVKIDNAAPFKISFNSPSDSIVTLATALNDTVHTVTIMNVIESFHRQPEFKGFLLDKGKNLVSPPNLPQRKIEFIGNSITCGYGIESVEASDPFTEETENHYYTYAAITARNLHAQHFAIARSGIGIYRNYNGPREGSPDCMPAMYNQTLFNGFLRNLGLLPIYPRCRMHKPRYKRYQHARL